MKSRAKVFKRQFSWEDRERQCYQLRKMKQRVQYLNIQVVKQWLARPATMNEWHGIGVFLTWQN